MIKNKIKIGLDFHGVINQSPEYFSKFSQSVKKWGYELHIITGGPKSVIEEYLQQYNIYYTNIFTIIDFYDALGKVEHLPDGKFKVPNELWDSAKGEYCQKHRIDIHIDDSLRYAQWFKTPFCHYNAQTQKCRLGEDITINFVSDTDDVLAQIDNILKNMSFMP